MEESKRAIAFFPPSLLPSLTTYIQLERTKWQLGARRDGWGGVAMRGKVAVMMSEELHCSSQNFPLYATWHVGSRPVAIA